MAIRGSRRVLNREKRAKQITLAVLLVLLTVSIVLAVPETITKTPKSKARVVEKGINNKNDKGTMEWNKTFENLAPRYHDDVGYCVKQTDDGGYIIVGHTRGDYSGEGSDVWLIKTDENGDKVWDQTYGGTSYDKAYWVEQTTDEGYIITGTTYSYGFYDTFDVWLIKVPQHPEVSEFPWDAIFLALAVIGIVAMMIVLVKRKS